jgi:hypothetical protein
MHGVRNALPCPAKERAVSTRSIVMATSLAGVLLCSASVNEAAAPIVVEESAQVVPLTPSPVPPTRALATLPTVTPLRETLARSEDAPRASYTVVALPTLAPQRTLSSLPTVTPSREPEATRTGCDPAYPDERTCIPPGPPFEQGCGITGERRFTVLAPDPQHLDHDRDGIGCEPIGSS